MKILVNEAFVLEIEILGVSQFFKKLKTHRDELESIIDETAETFKLNEK